MKHQDDRATIKRTEKRVKQKPLIVVLTGYLPRHTGHIYLPVRRGDFKFCPQARETVNDPYGDKISRRKTYS